MLLSRVGKTFFTDDIVGEVGIAFFLELFKYKGSYFLKVMKKEGKRGKKKVMHKVKKSFKRLFLGCQATANAEYNQNGNDMSAAKAVDGNDESRWSSEGADPGWLQVDLGAQKTFSQFRILSEGGTGVTAGKQLIGKFKIEGSNGMLRIGFTLISEKKWM